MNLNNLIVIICYYTKKNFKNHTNHITLDINAFKFTPFIKRKEQNCNFHYLKLQDFINYKIRV